MNRINTHCALRLGDNICHLHFLRAQAKANPEIHFAHHAFGYYLPQLVEVVADVPNISLHALEHTGQPADSFDAWKNTGGFWERHPLKNEYAEFMLEWFSKLAGRMGLCSTFTKPTDLLFDYPALEPDKPASDPFDFLIINSSPMSGQAQGYNLKEMDGLIGALAGNYTVVTTQRGRNPVQCTQDNGLTVTQIGRLSLRCRYILMVSTGPSWPTLNLFNAMTVEKRIIIIQHERLGLTLAERTEHVQTVGQARAALLSAGLL